MASRDADSIALRNAVGRVASCEHDLRLDADSGADAVEEWGLDCWAVAECDSQTIMDQSADWVVTEWQVRQNAVDGATWVRGRPDQAGGFGHVGVEFAAYALADALPFSPREIAEAEGAGDVAARAEAVSVALRAWLLRAVRHHAGVGPDWPGESFPAPTQQRQLDQPNRIPPTAGQETVVNAVHRFAEQLRMSKSPDGAPDDGWGLDCTATGTCSADGVRDGRPVWVVTEWRVTLNTADGRISVWGNPDRSDGFSDIRIGYRGDGESTAIHEYAPSDVAACAAGDGQRTFERSQEIGGTLRAWLTGAVEHHADVDLRWPAEGPRGVETAPLGL